MPEKDTGVNLDFVEKIGRLIAKVIAKVIKWRLQRVNHSATADADY